MTQAKIYRLSLSLTRTQACTCNMDKKQDKLHKLHCLATSLPPSFSWFVWICIHIADNMPTVLWVWDVPQLKLCAVLIQASPIKCKLMIAVSTSRYIVIMKCSNMRLSFNSVLFVIVRPFHIPIFSPACILVHVSSNPFTQHGCLKIIIEK